MSSGERAVIYVESGTSLRSPKGGILTPTGNNTMKVQGSNSYVIKIQIGEEPRFNPVRIDVSTGRRRTPFLPCEEEGSSSSSGQSSPRSDMTPPPRINKGGGNRFGSENSESDTESDVSSEIFRPSCSAAKFAMREICNVEVVEEPRPPPLPKSAPIVEKATPILGPILTLSESMALKRKKEDSKKIVVVDESNFHLDEINGISNSKGNTKEGEESLSNFAGVRDIFARRGGDGQKQILSDRGTIRGVKNRVRDGIATFLQSKDTKVR